MESIGSELIKLFKAHRVFLSSKLAEINLYSGQEGLLYYLSLKDGQSMSELIEKLSIKHATLFKMTERMAKENLLEKRKDKIDKRSSRLFLTKKGKQKLMQLSHIWKETESKISAGFTSTQKNEIITYLNQLVLNLNKN